MTSERIALVENGVVTNIILANLKSYKPLHGVSAVSSTTANIGDYYKNGEFSVPEKHLKTEGLIAYARQKQLGLVNSWVSINVAKSGKPPQIIFVDLKAKGRLDLMGLVQLATINPKFTTTWVQSSGNIVLNAAQISMLATNVHQFINDIYKTLGLVLAGIAEGKIVSYQQIDEVYKTLEDKHENYEN